MADGSLNQYIQPFLPTGSDDLLDPNLATQQDISTQIYSQPKPPPEKTRADELQEIANEIIASEEFPNLSAEDILGVLKEQLTPEDLEDDQVIKTLGEKGFQIRREKGIPAISAEEIVDIGDALEVPKPANLEAPDESYPPEAKEAAILSYGEDLRLAVKTTLGREDYALNSMEINQAIDGLTNDALHQFAAARGRTEELGIIGPAVEAAARVSAGFIQEVSEYTGDEEWKHFAQTLTDPSVDSETWAQIASGLGQAGAQVGAIGVGMAAGATTGGAVGLVTGGVPGAIAGGAIGAGKGAAAASTALFSNLVWRSIKESYNEAFQATGDRERALEAGLERLPTAVAENLVDVALAHGLAKVVTGPAGKLARVSQLDKAGKTKYLSNAIRRATGLTVAEKLSPAFRVAKTSVIAGTGEAFSGGVGELGERVPKLITERELASKTPGSENVNIPSYTEAFSEVLQNPEAQAAIGRQAFIEGAVGAITGGISQTTAEVGNVAVDKLTGRKIIERREKALKELTAKTEEAIQEETKQESTQSTVEPTASEQQVATEQTRAQDLPKKTAVFSEQEMRQSEEPIRLSEPGNQVDIQDTKDITGASPAALSEFGETEFGKKIPYNPLLSDKTVEEWQKQGGQKWNPETQEFEDIPYQGKFIRPDTTALFEADRIINERGLQKTAEELTDPNSKVFDELPTDMRLVLNDRVLYEAAKKLRELEENKAPIEEIKPWQTLTLDLLNEAEARHSNAGLTLQKAKLFHILSGLDPDMIIQAVEHQYNLGRNPIDAAHRDELIKLNNQRNALEAVTREETDLKQQVAQTHQSIVQDIQTRKELEQEIPAREEERAGKEQELKNLKEDLATLQDKEPQAEDKLQKQIDRAKKKLEQTEARLGTAIANEVSDQVKELRTEKTVLQKQITALRNKIRGVPARIETIHKMESRIQELETVLPKLANEVEKKTQALNEAKERAKTRMSDLKDLSNLFKQISKRKNNEIKKLRKQEQNVLKTIRQQERKIAVSTLPDATKAQLRKLADLAAKAPENSVIRQQIGAEMMNELSKLDVSPFAIAESYWIANILSGAGTHAINLISVAEQMVLRFPFNALIHPLDRSAYFQGLLSGAAIGLEEGKATLQGKHTMRSTLNKLNAANTLELILNPNDTTAVGKIKNAISLGRFVGRALGAEDNFTFRTAAEGRAYLASAQTARRIAKDGGYKMSDGTILTDPKAIMGQLLHNSAEEFAQAREQAENDLAPLPEEYKTENQIRLRTFEILEAKRPEEITRAAHRYGQVRTYTQTPEGSLGVVARNVNSLINGFAIKTPLGTFKPLKYEVPFVDVVANVTSNHLDYFPPVGFARAVAGHHIWGLGEKTQFDIQERIDRAVAAMMGAGALTIVEGLINAHEDEEEPYIDIWGSLAAVPGSIKDPTSKKGQLYQRGIRPWTIKFGNHYFRYHETPLVFPLGTLGEYHDRKKYIKSFGKEALKERLEMAVTFLPATLADTGFLKNVGELIKVGTGETPPERIKATLANITSGFIPAKGFGRDIQKLFDPEIIAKDSLWARVISGVPFAQHIGTRPALNMFGEPIKTEGIERTFLGRFATDYKEDPNARFLAEKNIWIPRLGNQITQDAVGKRGKTRIMSQREADADYGRAYAGVFTREEQYKLIERSGPQIRSIVERLRASYPQASSESLQARLDKEARAIYNKEKAKLAQESISRVKQP